MLRAPAKLEYFKTKCFWNNIFQQKQWSSHNGINNLKTLVLKFSILFFTLYIWVERAQQSFQCLKLLKVLIGNGRRVPYILPRSHPDHSIWNCNTSPPEFWLPLLLLYCPTACVLFFVHLPPLEFQLHEDRECYQCYHCLALRKCCWISQLF